MAEELNEVDPFGEISFICNGQLVLKLGQKIVPMKPVRFRWGIIKAIEVGAGLVLPADMTIKISK
jgi:hypothetical protein